MLTLYSLLPDLALFVPLTRFFVPTSRCWGLQMALRLSVHRPVAVRSSLMFEVEHGAGKAVSLAHGSGGRTARVERDGEI